MELMEKLKTAGKMRDEIIATDFLVTAKSAVRTYAVAITETASPEVREVLKKQLNQAIDTHAKIANYMIKNEMYHAYDVNEQLSHDEEKIKTALEMVND
ncbi:spore coat protein [Sediminibacillus massiliensis]|uniref:spore coat protein n=1 Tax=Sediminibacillus massiliensis TaxID=1926277 RepID=UPI000BAE6674|nr:spore coat protein [Sediminibacillus massiliensis]